MALYGEARRERPEANLIRAAQRGNVEALEQLFREYRRPMLHNAIRVLRNVADAEDALQDAFLLAYLALGRFEGRSRFSTWLTRIVINSALMRRRALSRRPAVSIDEQTEPGELSLSETLRHPSPNPEEEFAGRELRELIYEKIDELPVALSEAFVLCELNGYTSDQAAKRLRLTGSAMKARKFRARHRVMNDLSECLQEKQANTSDAPRRRSPRYSARVDRRQTVGCSQSKRREQASLA